MNVSRYIRIGTRGLLLTLCAGLLLAQAPPQQAPPPQPPPGEIPNPQDPRYQEHLIGGIRWALGLSKGSTEPLPARTVAAR